MQRINDHYYSVRFVRDDAPGNTKHWVDAMKGKSRSNYRRYLLIPLFFKDSALSDTDNNNRVKKELIVLELPEGLQQSSLAVLVLYGWEALSANETILKAHQIAADMIYQDHRVDSFAGLFTQEFPLAVSGLGLMGCPFEVDHYLYQELHNGEDRPNPRSIVPSDAKIIQKFSKKLADNTFLIKKPDTIQ